MKNPYELDISGALVPIANRVGHPYYFVVLPPKATDRIRGSHVSREVRWG